MFSQWYNADASRLSVHQATLGCAQDSSNKRIKKNKIKNAPLHSSGYNFFFFFLFRGKGKQSSLWYNADVSRLDLLDCSWQNTVNEW